MSSKASRRIERESTEMTTRTFRQVYRDFHRMYADSEPIRTAQELEAALHAAGVGPEQATMSWLEGLDDDWVYHRAEEPFDLPTLNREYRRLLGL